MLNRVVAKGFLSWESLDFEIHQGITQIDGYNLDDDTSEGSGKSAVLNAICWGCYGKIPKDTNIDDVIKEGEKECIVENHFEGFSIIRTRKSGRGDLYIQEGDKITKGKDVKETQELINEKLGLTFETFCQTVYFAQDYDKKFITSNQEDKGKILSEIQDLKLFDKARKETQELIKLETGKISKLKVDRDIANQELNFLKEKIQMTTNFINTQKQDIQAKINQNLVAKENHQTTLDKAHAELTELVDKYNAMEEISVDDAVAQVESDIEQLDAAKAEIQKSLAEAGAIAQNKKFKRDQISNLDFQSTKLLTKIQKLQDFIQNPTKLCPTCGAVQEQTDTSHAEAEVESLQKEVEENSLKKAQIQHEMDQLVVPDVQEANASIAEINSAIGNCKAQINELRLQALAKKALLSKIDDKTVAYEALAKQAEFFDRNIAELESKTFTKEEAEIEKFETTHKEKSGAVRLLEDMVKESEAYQNRLELLKDGFKEIKSYVFNSVLAELTVKTNKYLDDLFHMPVTLKFTNDDMKIGTIIKIDGTERAYGLLSGGQAKRVSIATDLALSEIISRRKSNKLNFRCFDEPFKNLSESSMVKCVDLFQKLSGSTLLIEHNSMVKPIANHVFEVELKDRTSRVK